MKPSDYAEAVRRETAALAAVLNRAPDNAVPSCPGWNVTDLAEHLAEVQRFWLDVVENRRLRREDAAPESRPEDRPLSAWLLEGSERLASALEAADPAEAVWSWSSDKTAGFVQRRQAQEAAVHRWDSEAAAGRPSPIDAALAAEGIAEFFDSMLTHNDPQPIGSGETLAVVPSDAGQPWRVTFQKTGCTVEAGQSEADCVLSGRASDLLLVLWRRLPEETIALEGETGILIRLMSVLDLE